MLKNVYEGLNARPKVYLSKEYFCEMYPTCVSSKLCEFIPKVPMIRIYMDTFETIHFHFLQIPCFQTLDSLYQALALAI